MKRDVDGDMIRFQVHTQRWSVCPQMMQHVSGVWGVYTQDDPEEERAKLWFTVACNSASPHQQLKAFQTAIETLTVSRTSSFIH